MLTINEYFEENKMEKYITIDEYIKKRKKKEQISKEVEHIMKYSIKKLLKINFNLIDKFNKDNNDPYYIKMEDNYGRVLYVYYFIRKGNDINIKTYRTINNQKVITIIKELEDLDSYGFISMDIYNKNELMHKIYCINDFKNMLNDVRTMVFLKIIMNIKNINILEFDSNYKISLIELFFIHCFLNNKKGVNIDNFFKVSIKCSDKYKNKSIKSLYIYNLIKSKIKKTNLDY